MDRQIDMYKDLRKKARKANEKLVFYHLKNVDRMYYNYLKSVEV